MLTCLFLKCWEQWAVRVLDPLLPGTLIAGFESANAGTFS